MLRNLLMSKTSDVEHVGLSLSLSILSRRVFNWLSQQIGLTTPCNCLKRGELRMQRQDRFGEIAQLKAYVVTT